MKPQYFVCRRCVMDTSDPDIVFDEKGVCNHCHTYERMVQNYVFSGEKGKKALDLLIKKIKDDGKGMEYDCIIGVSGGVDSSYVAYLVHMLGLRPIAIHLDNGWDSELAVKNIELLLKKLGIDLCTTVLDWEEFRDLQLAFLRASTPDSEIPTDHAIIASLFGKAKEFGVKYIINGANIRTESHLPPAWSQGHLDWLYIKSINNAHGNNGLKKFPHMTLLQRLIYRRNLKSIPILNYVDYSKKEAIKTLEDELGWKYYGGKHYESIFTRFYQGYILPRKFGYDKRRTHFSSLICSGEMSREEALDELKKDIYPIDLMANDKEFVIKKFELFEEEFNEIMALPIKSFYDYPSYEKILRNPLWYGIVRRMTRQG